MVTFFPNGVAVALWGGLGGVIGIPFIVFIFPCGGAPLRGKSRSLTDEARVSFVSPTGASAPSGSSFSPAAPFYSLSLLFLLT